MNAKQTEKFEKTNICWICGKLIDFVEKVRDRFHVTGKHRDAAHWSC